MRRRVGRPPDRRHGWWGPVWRRCAYAWPRAGPFAMGTTPGKPPSIWDPRQSGTLVEREGELELLRRLVGEAAEGRGSLLMLDGPAGIGKSGLLAAGHDHAAARGFQLLRARGGELERGFPN